MPCPVRFDFFEFHDSHLLKLKLDFAEQVAIAQLSCIRLYSRIAEERYEVWLAEARIRIEGITEIKFEGHMGEPETYIIKRIFLGESATRMALSLVKANRSPRSLLCLIRCASRS